MAINKCSLDNLLKAVLSVGNNESNQSYPPSIFEQHFNLTTSMLLDALVASYPKNERAVEMLEPFTVVKKTPNTNGYIQLDDNFRNLLTLAINIKPDGSDCDGSNPAIATPAGFQNTVGKAGCKTVPIKIVPQSEWDYLTSSKYKFPTMEAPIGCLFGTHQIKVCPYDIPKAEVRYIRQEKVYKYGYIMQPDDTFIYDPNTSIESEWTSAAFTPLFKALTSLYAAYTRDNDVRDWSLILNEKGIL